MSAADRRRYAQEVDHVIRTMIFGISEETVNRIVSDITQIRDRELERIAMDFQANDEVGLADAQTLADENGRLRHQLAFRTELHQRVHGRLREAEQDLGEVIATLIKKEEE